MNAFEHFLGGRAWKRSLPKLELPLPSDAPALKRLMLPQGELAQFYDQPEGIRYLAWIELIPGKARGHHYHKVKQEYVYVLAGETDLVVADLNSTRREVIPLRAGDLAYIEPFVTHVLLPLTTGHAVEFSPQAFDNADIHRHQLA